MRCRECGRVEHDGWCDEQPHVPPVGSVAEGRRQQRDDAMLNRIRADVAKWHDILSTHRTRKPGQ